MEKALPLKILAVLRLVLLGSNVNEGRIVSKCELKAQLEAAFGRNVTANMTTNMPGSNATRDLVAKFVCFVNRTSRFNTSVITTIQVSNPEQPNQKPIEPNVGRPGERPPPSNVGRPGERPPPSNVGRPGERPPPLNVGRPGERPPPSNVGHPGERPSPSNVGRPDGRARSRRSPPRNPEGGNNMVPPSSSGVSPNVTVHLLGIFQLNDCVACDSGSNQSLNVCRMNCSALTDDDIRDDVGCLKTLITKISNTTTAAPGSPLLPEKMDFFFPEECHAVISSSYLADCV
ncbi:uncharacterized protein [Paramisgurnus dabryanus]|uniref:uncharacterized protein n=1 Tax=Paramisgurnus dabryanus TaxID=90735 RepID=UPI003CCF8AE9